MPLLRQYKIGGAEISVWKITETVDELSLLVPKDIAAVCFEKFSSEKRCLEWLAVRAMVAQLYGPAVRVVYDASGKPELAGADISISISHTEGYAAIACSRDFILGLDVERPTRSVLSVAERFMQADMLRDMLPDDANRLALCHWCAKEALFKITGNLGGNFKDNISVDCSGINESGTLSLELVGLECGGSFIADYRFVDGLLLVLCRQKVKSVSKK